VLQNAVDAILNGDFGVTRFDVDVAARRSSAVKMMVSTRRTTGLAVLSRVRRSRRNRLVAFLVFLGGLESESFGGLFENALRLLGAF